MATYRAKDEDVQEQQLKVQELVVRTSDNQFFGEDAGSDTVIVINEPLSAIVSCMYIDNSSAGAGGLKTIAAADLSIVNSSDFGGSGSNDAVKVLNISSDGSGDGLEMGAAGEFAVLANSTITNTGNTVIDGDLGLFPGTSVTGFPPGIVNGTQEVTTARAAQAQVDLAAAIVDLESRSVTTNYSGTDLGTLSLAPGVYKFNTSAQLTGTLVLNGGGSSSGVWVFQIGSTLTTASASVVSLINGAQASNVFWQVGSSATLGTTTNFKGSILADASITVNTGASVEGRLLARDAAVTLDNNAVNGVGGVELESGDCFILKYITVNQ